jgi:hypothetical protein
MMTAANLPDIYRLIQISAKDAALSQEQSRACAFILALCVAKIGRFLAHQVGE